MRMTILRASVCCFLLLSCGCATKPKTYHAPDAAKLNAAQKSLDQKAQLARATAVKARTATLNAQAHGWQLIALAKAVKDKLGILMGKVPPELVPLVKDVQDATTAQELEESSLRQAVDEAVGWNTQLAAQQIDVENARLAVITEADQYMSDSGAIAQDATDERNARIRAEKALSLSRWYGWLWKIGAGLFVVCLVAFIILKSMGKLAIVGAKVAAKVEGI